MTSSDWKRRCWIRRQIENVVGLKTSLLNSSSDWKRRQIENVIRSITSLLNLSSDWKRRRIENVVRLKTSLLNSSSDWKRRRIENDAAEFDVVAALEGVAAVNFPLSDRFVDLSEMGCLLSLHLRCQNLHWIVWRERKNILRHFIYYPSIRNYMIILLSCDLKLMYK